MPLSFLHLPIRNPFFYFLRIKSDAGFDFVKREALLPTEFIDPNPGYLHHF
jgi:hypothetical protein